MVGHAVKRVRLGVMGTFRLELHPDRCGDAPHLRGHGEPRRLLLGSEQLGRAGRWDWHRTAPAEGSGTERTLTAEAFQRPPDESGYRHELVRGMVVRSPGPGPRHGEVEANVVAIPGSLHPP
jgi:hypothetical protein